MEDIYEDQFLKLQVRDEVSKPEGPILLSFTGVGHAMGGVDVQQVEFFGAGRDFANVIFIMDLTRSWGNALDIDLLKEKLAPYIEGRQIYAIGNSMGGFLSVLLSNFITIDVVVAIVPQFSVSPNVVPHENRWKEYRDEIKEYRFESLEGKFVPGTKYYLLSSGLGQDVMHWLHFPTRPNVYNYVFQNVDHNLAARLKTHGHLNSILQQCFDETFDHRLFNQNSHIKARRIYSD